MQPVRALPSTGRDLLHWRASSRPLVRAAAGPCPLVVTLTPAEDGAYLHDGGSVRRQLARGSDVITRMSEAHGRHADETVLLAPASWLHLAGPAELAGQCEHLGRLLGDDLASVPVAAVVFGVRFSLGRGQDADAVFVFDRARRQITWGGARSRPRRHWLTSPEEAPDHVAEIPVLGPSLVLNDHYLLALARTRGSTILETARQAGVRHVLHAAYAAASDRLWAGHLEQLRRELPGVAGWASAGRATADAPAAVGLAAGVDHLAVTLRLG